MTDAQPPLRRDLRSSAPDAPASGPPAADAPAADAPATDAAPSPRPSTDAPAPADSATPNAIQVEPAPPEVALGGEASVLPGEHRGGFARELTAPVDVTSIRHDEPQPEEGWTPTASLPTHGRRVSLAAGVLALGIAALALSIFVVWGLPIGIAAVVLAVVALRRGGSRPMLVWALVLGAVAIVYGAGWLAWALIRLG